MARIRNLDKLTKRLRSLTSKKAERMLGAALFEGGETIQVHAQRSITAGAVSGKGHVPSAPNTPPNADTHVLSDGIETTQPETLVVHVTSTAPYSARHEFGPEGRKFMRPARDAKRKEIRKRFAQQVNRIVRGAAE